MKQIVRKEEGLILTCLLPEGRMEGRAADSRPGLIYFHGAQNAQDGLRLPEELLEAAGLSKRRRFRRKGGRLPGLSYGKNHSPYGGGAFPPTPLSCPGRRVSCRAFFRICGVPDGSFRPDRQHFRLPLVRWFSCLHAGAQALQAAEAGLLFSGRQGKENRKLPHGPGGGLHAGSGEASARGALRRCGRAGFLRIQSGESFCRPGRKDGKGVPVAAAGGMTGGRTGSEPERVWSI